MAIDRAQAPAGAPITPGGRAVLLVDDERDILDSLRGLIEATIDGVDVYTAGSGEEALGIVADHHVNLVISDFKMPGMDGITLLKRLQDDAPHIPRMLMTAFGDPDLQRRAHDEAGVIAFLAKPFDLELVTALVEDVLSK